MAVRNLDGPRLAPARGLATHLVVLCHGYGADGNDLLGLAPHWQALLPTVAFAAPDAPDPCDGAPMGRQWFPISRLERAEMQHGVESAAAGLDTFLDTELARLQLPPERLALAGFSQGTMMALHVGLARTVKPAAIVGFSGLLAADRLDEFGPDAPPVFLVHGDDDPTIPPQALFASAAMLGRAGISVQWHISQGIGHSIDADGLSMAGMFLVMAFGGTLRRQAPEISCPAGS